MAIIEIVRFNSPNEIQEAEIAGLRLGYSVNIRTTTSSFSDYPEWDLENLRNQASALTVTDGTCS